MFLPLHDHNPTRRTPFFTVLLIVVNVLIFFLTAAMPEAEQAKLYANWGFVPQRIRQLNDPNLVVKVNVTPIEDQADVEAGRKQPKEISLPADQGAILLTLLTTMFLHGSWMHVLGNMWFLWLFGNNIEDRLGHFMFLGFYFATGLLATACHWAYDPSSSMPVVGASGALAGVLGAYAVTFPTARVKTLIFFFFVDLPAMLFLGAWFLIQVYFAIEDPESGGVAFWAHIGGFVAGCGLMPLMALGAPDPGTHWEDEIDEAFRF